jgi:hypothetical protein
MVYFANPAAWLLAGLLAVLVALYRWERTRRTIAVPSLLLWQTVPRSTTRATRFLPDWLFVLQALLLLLLIGGLARPYLSSAPGGRAPQRAVYVLDCSASMQAREGRESRFDLARRALRERIAELHADDEVMLIAAGPQPAVAVAPTADHAEALRQLAALEPTDTHANLDAALATAQRAAGRGDRTTRVELYSDTPLDRLSPGWRRTVSVFPVGETDDNLAIEGVQVFQSRFDDPRAARAFVTIRNYAARETHGMLTVQLDDSVFDRQGFTLGPRSAGGFPLAALPGAGVLRAALDVDDALAPDNRAYAVVHAPQPLRLLVVSDDDALLDTLRRIVAAAPNLHLETLSPAAYVGQPAADLILFHRVAPPIPDHAASLYVAPATADGAFPSSGRLARATLSDAAIGHPALRSLTHDLPYPLTAVETLAVPAWAEPLLQTDAGDRELPLAFAGQANQHRQAVLAFDLADQGLLRADRVDLLVLLLDLIDWLVPARDDARVVPTGSVEVIEGLPSLPRHIVDPRGRQSTLPADTLPLIDARLAGEYRIAANGTAVRLFANLVDADESDIGRPAARAHLVPPIAGGSSAAAPPDGSFGWWLYVVAASLLILEWLAARRRA